MRTSIYLETSIISYLTARPSADQVTAACQKVTEAWWEKRRKEYALFTSPLVITEVSAGDPEAAARRLEVLRSIPQLHATDSARQLVEILIASGALPYKARADALHIAIATVHRVDYLLTWNCRHIDNPATKPLIRATCEKEGHMCSEICTPLEMMEVQQNGK
ncbi:MAG: type II toxin-antitoxin system VapC family toxin [Candidatus Hydrogenedentes bacterium]|nr:type II toxin-antitoxin system VapC family toxin [Candidatus Hydrogenedentota bacterium]